MQHPRTTKSLAQLTAREALKYAPEILAALRYRWDFWARPEQVPPDWPWSIHVNMGGRGSGKTRSAAEWLRSKIEASKEPLSIALVGRTARDIRTVMVEGESGLLGVFPDGEARYVHSHAKVVFPKNGSQAVMLSAENAQELRGFQFHYAWADEVATYDDIELTMENLLLCLRLGNLPQLFITSNPLPRHHIPWLAEIIDHPERRNVSVVRSTTFDNLDNLPADFKRRAEELASTAFGQQEVMGEMVELTGLFRREWIKSPAGGVIPPGGTTIVAVDPSIGGSRTRDETGIVVVKRVGDCAYVLEDCSGYFSPEEWARKAVDAAKRHKAARIVAETNSGADTVSALIRQFDRQIPIKEVKATKAKDLRAAPVAALYERGKVFHAHEFKSLEQQMTTFDPSSNRARRGGRSAASPDRLDALVWGITDLGFHIGVAKFKPINVELPKTTF